MRITITASELQVGDFIVTVDGFSRFEVTRLHKTDRRVSVVLCGMTSKSFRPDAEIKVDRE